MELTITKKIAKQGSNLVLIIPKNLHPFLSQGDLVKVQIGRVVDEPRQAVNDHIPSIPITILPIPDKISDKNTDNQDNCEVIK